ncbi:MAG: hemerythrin family protein [Deltaproteobacteria bacterium]|nr:hemerythrin family protein [Deltaproteobacteria bacterium]
MGIIQWSDRFATGDKSVDEQHKELFRLVNKLHDAMKQGKGKEHTVPTIKALAAYVVKHFAAEEALMERSKYPGLAQHRKIHEDLTGKVGVLLADAQAGKNIFTTELSHFLADWLRNHIEGTDQKMVAWVTSNSTARAAPV